MTVASGTAVQKAITVEAPVERAFKVFTERFDEIKPRDHNLLSVPIAETVFEPRVGGHVYDRGTEVEYYCYDTFLFPARLRDDDFDPDRLWRH